MRQDSFLLSSQSTRALAPAGAQSRLAMASHITRDVKRLM
jgi:hypothetical protein